MSAFTIVIVGRAGKTGTHATNQPDLAVDGGAAVTGPWSA